MLPFFVRTTSYQAIYVGSAYRNGHVKVIETLQMNEKDASQIDFGRELFGKHVVAAQTYARVNKIYGDRDLTDLVADVHSVLTPVLF